MKLFLLLSAVALVTCFLITFLTIGENKELARVNANLKYDYDGLSIKYSECLRSFQDLDKACLDIHKYRCKDILKNKKQKEKRRKK